MSLKPLLGFSASIYFILWWKKLTRPDHNLKSLITLARGHINDRRQIATACALSPRLSVFEVFTANNNFVQIFSTNCCFKFGICMNLCTFPRTIVMTANFSYYDFPLWTVYHVTIFDQMKSRNPPPPPPPPFHVSTSILFHISCLTLHDYQLSHWLFSRKNQSHRKQACVVYRLLQTSPRKWNVWSDR